MAFTASVVLAAPWNSQGGKTEVIPMPPETWLKMDTGDGGFQLWITGGRELHCVYKPEEKFGGKPGWSDSTAFPGFVYRCNEI